MSKPEKADRREELSAESFGEPVFGKHDFATLWSSLVLAGNVPDIGDELHQLLVIDDSGVRFRQGLEQGMQWSPRMYGELSAGHWRDHPLLSFPFSASDLAMFMLNGPGWWLAEAFGGMDAPSPDLHILGAEVGEDEPGVCRREAQLIRLAWAAYARAVEVAGPRPLDAAETQDRAVLEFTSRHSGEDLSDAALAAAWAAEMPSSAMLESLSSGHEQKLDAWLKLMVRALRTEPAVAVNTEREAPAARRARRLARLRELGGDMRKAGSGWQTTPRGVLAMLIREEAAAGRPMADKTNVRADLAAALEDKRGT